MSTEAVSIAESISKAYESFIETEERRSQQKSREYVYASSWRLCTRQMALDMITPGIVKPFETTTLANFRRGKDRERDLRSDLARAGRNATPQFELVGAEERFELRDHKGRVVIVGKVDAQLQFDRTRHPLEVKSWNPNLVAKVKKFEDLFEGRWTRSGAHQLLAYMLAMNIDLGFMLLDRNGLPLLLEVKLWENGNHERIEDFLNRAEVAMDAREWYRKLPSDVEGLDAQLAHMKEGQMPPFIDDPSECRKCPYFGSACNPPVSYDGADIITDETMLALLEQHETVKESHLLYDHAHDDLAEYLKVRTPKTFKDKNKKQIIAGDFLIEARWIGNTTLVFPDDKTKLQFQKKDPVGKFEMKITKVNQ